MKKKKTKPDEPKKEQQNIKLVINYFCAVEGQQEKMYLEHIEKLLTDWPKKIVNFNIIIGGANRLKSSYTKYNCACLFDHDLLPDRFEENLNICTKLNNQNKGSKKNPGFKVYAAYSSICFDLWLLLHRKFVSRPAASAEEYVDDVRKVYDLPEEADIKSKDIMEKIVKKITLDDVKWAIENAQKIKSRKLPEDRRIVAGTDISYYSDPYFEIDSFIEKVINETGS